MENSELGIIIKELRTKRGISQEELAEISGLSLRTIQRIENGETIPRGDTLKRLAVALQVSPNEIIDWQMQEDNNVITMLNLSQLGFLLFPFLGIIIPLTIWILKKEKIRNVDSVGKSILNFQISWTIVLFLLYFLFGIRIVLHFGISPFPMSGLILIIVVFYLYNFLMILINTIRFHKNNRVKYLPAFMFLN